MKNGTGLGSRPSGSTGSIACSATEGDGRGWCWAGGPAPSDPERVLGNALVLDNATFRLLGVGPAWTRYLVLDFRFAAVSDEKREGVLRLVVNQATGAMPTPFSSRSRPGSRRRRGNAALPMKLPPAWDRRRVLDLVAEALPSRLDARLAPSSRGCGGD